MREGACTGFGLAAVINYLFFHQAKVREAAGQKAGEIMRVSPWMLYSLARRYDEWPGEDYEGSSCRGAMKGWFHHGVCREGLWPVPHGTSPRQVATQDTREEISAETAVEPWQTDAAERPLGVYYRISVDSISDMQSAIAEVGAIYISADVHAGWSAVRRVNRCRRLPGRPKRGDTGGHALALVGYDETGFIVQNSWGLRGAILGSPVLHTLTGWRAALMPGSPSWASRSKARRRISCCHRRAWSAAWRQISPVASPMALPLQPQQPRSWTGSGRYSRAWSMRL